MVNSRSPRRNLHQNVIFHRNTNTKQKSNGNKENWKLNDMPWRTWTTLFSELPWTSSTNNRHQLILNKLTLIWLCYIMSKNNLSWRTHSLTNLLFPLKFASENFNCNLLKWAHEERYFQCKQTYPNLPNLFCPI